MRRKVLQRLRLVAGSHCVAGLLLCCLVATSGCRRDDEAGKPAGVEDESLAPSREPLMPPEVRSVFARSCASCHGPDGRGIIGVAPDLSRVERREVDQWVTFLRQPGTTTASPHPFRSPPPVWLTEEELWSMARWLAAVATRPTGL